MTTPQQRDYGRLVDLPRYLGIDLAWTATAGSGVCVLGADGRILDEDQLPAAELTHWVRDWQGSRSVLALDGPLVVPTGSAALRPVERELHRRYGRDHAGPYPGGAASSSMRGRDRSPAAALVDAIGSYSVDPTDRASPHRAIEVFPAPTWLELFGLPSRIRYKRGLLVQRVDALGVLRGLLDRLALAEPPLQIAGVDGVASRAAGASTARAWKAVEDIIDARLCAYVAMLWDKSPAEPWVVTGSGTWRDGYVVVPALGHRPPVAPLRPLTGPSPAR